MEESKGKAQTLIEEQEVLAWSFKEAWSSDYSLLSEKRMADSILAWQTHSVTCLRMALEGLMVEIQASELKPKIYPLNISGLSRGYSVARNLWHS